MVGVGRGSHDVDQGQSLDLTKHRQAGSLSGVRVTILGHPGSDTRFCDSDSIWRDAGSDTRFCDSEFNFRSVSVALGFAPKIVTHTPLSDVDGMATNTQSVTIRPNSSK